MVHVRLWTVAVAVAVVAGCAASTAEPTVPLSLVVFGDSWSYGAHCDGCEPWPRLLPAAYASSLDVEVELTDLTENGGTSGSLLAELESDQRYRDAVTGADIVVFNIGSNDLEDSVDVAVLTETWNDDFDRMLDIVAELRDGQPTAVRMVGLSNEYLWDAGLRVALREAAPAFIAGFNDASCAAAARHGGQCVDLRPVLNGPDLDQPADGNTQESMDLVAAAIAAVGLAELGVE